MGGGGQVPAQVSTEPTNTVTTHKLEGDDGQLLAEDSPKATSPNYNFKSAEASSLELPLEKEAMSEVLVFKSIGNGVHILDEAYHVPGGNRCSWVRGIDSVNMLLNGATRSMAIKSNFSEPMIVPLRVGGTAVMVKSSSIFGLIAVEAPFVRGMRNAKYDLFSLKSGMLVSSSGMAIKNPHTELLIASSVSNKEVSQGNVTRDIFTEVEQLYVLSQQIAVNQANAYAKSIKETAVAQGIQASKTIDALKKELAEAKQNAAAQAQRIATSLNSLKKVPEADLGYLEKENQRFIAASKQEFGALSNHNVEFLAKLM